MKRFLGFPPALRGLITVSCTGALVALLVGWVRLVDGSFVWALGIFVVVPLLQFLLTPLFTALGWYTYYSPMVVSFGRSERVIDLHNGTSFDYLLEMRGVTPGAAWKRRMLVHYLSALLHIIEGVEEGRLSPAVVVRGSSYFLSRRSAERLGFEVGETTLPERLNLGLNYLDLTWTYSLSNGRLTFPDLRNTSTVRTTGEQLVARKDQVLRYLRRVGGG